MVIEMPVEIERKFLVVSDGWRREVSRSCRMVQGYLSDSGVTVRIRLAEGAGMLTVKGRPAGIARDEFEYPIPAADAEFMLASMVVNAPVEKIRHFVPAGAGLTWEIDEYLGANAPLFVAEIELPSEDRPFPRPEWLGQEVSGDGRYTNRALSRRPYSTWEDAGK